MRDEQIVAHLRVMHEKLGPLFELARSAQRKPSRQEALLTRDFLEAFGENGIVLRKSSFSAYPHTQKYVARAICDLAVTVFGQEQVATEAIDDPEQGEFTFKFALVNRDAVKNANTVHCLILFLTGLARIDRRALNTYWEQDNPELAEKERQRVRLMFANALGIIGGLQQTMGLGRFH
jgi:hypothetical protein